MDNNVVEEVVVVVVLEMKVAAGVEVWLVIGYVESEGFTVCVVVEALVVVIVVVDVEMTA